MKNFAVTDDEDLLEAIYLISIDGEYHEILVPYSNDNSGNFVVSHDGTHMIYGTGDVMKMMTLEKPV